MSTTTTIEDRGAAIRARHEQGRFDDLADCELIATVAGGLALPREAPADSFVLHSPLELTARASLLPFVRPEARSLARLRLTSLLDGYEHAGPGVTVSASRAGFAADSVEAAATLLAAIDAGDLEAIDGAATWLGRVASPDQMRRLLAAAVLPRLAAAAHAPIFLFHVARVAPRGEVSGELLRGLARELGRQPEWRLRWMEERASGSTEGPNADADALFEALAATPHEPEPARFFIYPTMAHVDQNGTAAELSGPPRTCAVRRAPPTHP